MSHSTAPLHVREMFSLDDAQLRAFALRVKDLLGLTELFVVSTCNRTEIYYTSTTDLSIELLKILSSEKGLMDHSLYIPFFEQFEGKNAVKRLFEVSAGLHSKVVGDLQIPNQIKQSYQAIADVDMAGPFMHRLLHSVFFTNKRIAQETSFRDGAASVTYISVSLATELLANKPNAKIVVLGLGEIGTDVCKYLQDSDFTNITVINRTLSKAEKIAEDYGFRVANIDALSTEIQDADFIISSARCETPLITKEQLRITPLLGFKYLIDLSVPRSVEEDIETVPGVILYNIDTLQAKADQALADRLAAIPSVNAIIAETVESFSDWSKDAMVSPTIHKLKNSLEQIRKEELARYLKNLSEAEAEKVDKITQSIIQKIIKMPVVQLKAACRRGEAENMIEAINELFDLEKVKDQLDS
jgi:glutamyl-tRNA reductase